MKRKLWQGYCNCGSKVFFSNSILPFKTECLLCGCKIYSHKTLTGKAVIYFVDDESIIKTVMTFPKENKLNDSL